MIKISFSAAVFLYLFISVIGLLVMWIFFEQKQKLKEFSSDERYIWQCSTCTYIYVDSRHEVMSLCPRCGSYSDRKQMRDSSV